MWQTILQNCIVHAKQSEITHTEMSLKQPYIPTLEREVCYLLQLQWSLMGIHHSSLVKWVKLCIIGVQNKHWIKYDIMHMESGWL